MKRSAHVLLASSLLVVFGAADAADAPDSRVVAGAEGAMMRRFHLMPFRPVASGRVPAGVEFQCERACTLQIDPSNSVVLSPGAIVVVDQYFYVPLVPNQPLVPAHQVELYEGSLEAVSTSEQARPLVVTVGSDKHVALRSARVQIVRRGAHAGVGVLSGTARVGANKSWITLAQEQATVLLAQGRPGTPRSVLDGPTWVTGSGGCPAGLSVTEQDTSVVVGGCWERMPQAESYVIEVAKDADFRHPLGAAESTPTTSWSRILGVGRYFARVRAIDTDGLTGRPSAAHQMAVVPFHLPPGSSANMDTRTLIVPEGREISFGNPEGLELATDNGGFLRAPPSVIVDSAPQHELRFRLKEDPSSVSTVYVAKRRALRATVDITPRKAQWPTDPIDIAVTIEDPSGQLDPTKVEANLKVLIGLREVPTPWTRHGATWSTRLHPRRMGGPTVVRVIVNDEHGTVIGRNFLEVDQADHLVAHN